MSFDVKYKFQFQYGTIKSTFQKFHLFQIFCFNSNMVRLKDQTEDKFQHYPCFNSNMVRLKGGGN